MHCHMMSRAVSLLGGRQDCQCIWYANKKVDNEERTFYAAWSLKLAELQRPLHALLAAGH